MSLFLLTYSRGKHEEPTIERIEDPAEAVQRFAEAGDAHRNGNGDHGVVLLSADSEETLRRTHMHYFMSLDEMLASLGVNGPSRG